MVTSHRGPPCPCAPHVSYSHVFLLLAGFSPWVVVFSTNDGPTFFIRVHRTDYRRPLPAQYVESSIRIAFPRAGQWYFRNRPGQVCTFLSLCFLIY